MGCSTCWHCWRRARRLCRGWFGNKVAGGHCRLGFHGHRRAGGGGKSWFQMGSGGAGTTGEARVRGTEQIRRQLHLVQRFRQRSVSRPAFARTIRAVLCAGVHGGRVSVASHGRLPVLAFAGQIDPLAPVSADGFPGAVRHHRAVAVCAGQVFEQHRPLGKPAPAAAVAAGSPADERHPLRRRGGRHFPGVGGVGSPGRPLCGPRARRRAAPGLRWERSSI